MLPTGETEERSMSKPSLDGRHRDKNGEISHKHGNTLIRTLRKIYGPGFAAGYPETEKLSEVLLQLNEASLSQLRRDHETRHRSKRSHVRSGSKPEKLNASICSPLCRRKRTLRSAVGMSQRCQERTSQMRVVTNK